MIELDHVDDNPMFIQDDIFLKVYPNPTTGSFTLELDDFIGVDRVYVEVYNTLGSLLINKELPNER